MFIFSDITPKGLEPTSMLYLIQAFKCLTKDNFNFDSTKSMVFPFTLEMSKLMGSFILTITALLCAMLVAKAQPSPCGATAAMTPTCVEACIICDIDGFTGINNSSITGQAPPGFCTTQVHHMQWIAFIAGTTNLTIELEVFNCRNNDGLEVGIYEAVECKNYKLVTDCDTDIPPNTKRIFKNKVPLTIGQYYFWVMDGSNNDVCNYTIRVLEGSTKVAPLETPAPISVPPVVCEGKTFNLSSEGLVGATIYAWYVDGDLVGSGKNVPISIDTPGKHTVCLDAMNVCDKAPQNCVEIEVLPSKETTLKHEVCFSECFQYAGNKYCDAGIHDVIFQAVNGCDSIVHLDLAIKDQVVVSQFARICEGDSLKLGDDAFTTAGPHIGYVTDQEGCKVKVNLDLEIIKCNIKAASAFDAVSCTGFRDGVLRIAVTNGTPPFTYSWKRLENESEKGSGQLLAENVYVDITGLDEGTYLVEISDNFGNFTVVQNYVTQPSPLVVSIKDSIINGYHVLCNGDATAGLAAEASGGTGNYRYNWSSGGQRKTISGLAAGTQTLQITDDNGCITTGSATITQPDQLVLSSAVMPPDCSGINSGSIDILQASGGVGSYTYLLNGKPAVFPVKNLGTGIYNTLILDENGCDFQVTDTLQSLEIPMLSGDSMYQLALGDSIELSIFSDVDAAKVVWSPVTDILNPEALETKARPVQSRVYVVSVTSNDGCVRTYEVSVNVEKRRSFVIANGLTSNAGVNATLRYFAGPDVSSLMNYRVYDRWGSKVFETASMPAGVIDIPWDKTFNGRAVMGGVYAWTAEVAYIDGEVITYAGALHIID